MEIVFSPVRNKKNKYAEIVTDAIRDSGIEVYSKSDYLHGRCRGVEYFHFNWYEKVNGLWKYITKYLLLNLLIIRKKKIIFTLHNKRAHSNGGRGKSKKYSNALMSFFIRRSHKVVIHSHESGTYLIDNYGLEVKEKLLYIPHPNYIDVYGDIVENKNDGQGLRLLFLGLIKEYKNVELLIDVVSSFEKQDVSLLIAGMADVNYRNLLKRKLSGRTRKEVDNITTHFEFVKDEEIPLYLSKCDLVVMPYDLASSLNSGSVILSFSYKKSVICPIIGTLTDMENECYFSYTYNSREEHKTALENIIREAIEMKKSNPRVFEEWGRSMYEEVAEKNSYSIVKNKIAELYISLLSFLILIDEEYFETLEYPIDALILI